MLYDILIIDDDFKSKPNSTDGSENAKTLLLSLLKEDLRVTWSTGESDEALQKLRKKDLSCIRFIILDLLLRESSANTNYKNINSIIMSVFQQINDRIAREEVICYINSNIINDESYGEEGQKDLIAKIASKYSRKYSMKVVKGKNSLSGEQKAELRNNNVKTLGKSLIINKTIEVEKIFIDEIKSQSTLNEKSIYKLTFDEKYKKYRSYKGSSLSACCKRRIQLLQQIRNKMAHTEGGKKELKEIVDDAMKITFWKILKGQELKYEINFENFDSLIKYISSVDSLCEELNSIKDTGTGYVQPPCLALFFSVIHKIANIFSWK